MHECESYQIKFEPTHSSPATNRYNTMLKRNLQSLGLRLDKKSPCSLTIKNLSFSSDQPFNNIRSGQLNLATSTATVAIETNIKGKKKSLHLRSNASEVQNAYLTEKRNFKRPLVDDLSYQIIRNLSKS